MYIYRSVQKLYMYTFKDRRKSPAGHWSTTGKLSHRRLQEEQWHPDNTHHDGKRDEECPATIPENTKFMGNSLFDQLTLHRVWEI